MCRRKGAEGLTFRVKLLGLAYSIPWFPLGVGHLLGSFPPSVAPIRKEQTWGRCRRNSHDSDDPCSARPTSPFSLLSSLGGTSPLEIAHVVPVSPRLPRFAPSQVAQWGGHWLGR